MNRTVKKPVMKHGFLAAVILSVLCVLSPAGVFADCPDSVGKTIRVPLDYPTIQGAINSITAGATATGYTILVAPGTYKEVNIAVGQRGILIESEEGAYSTIIDCDTDGNGTGNGRGFYFDNTVLGSTILRGFTIINGYSDANGGGGIYINGSSPTIADCTITSCTAPSSNGGGIRAVSSGADITNCILSDNKTVTAGLGGAISLESCTASMSIDGCEISSNTSVGRGGGIYLTASVPSINSCILRYNTSSNEGGSMAFVGASNAVLTSVTMSEGTASYGGSLYVNASNPTFDYCTIGGSNASVHGGNIHIYSGAPKLRGCAISGGGVSTSNRVGGGVWVENGTPEFWQCTFANNIANKGGAVYQSTGTGYYYNCFFNNNQVLCDDGEGRCGTNPAYGGAIYMAGGTAYIYHCTITNNYAHNHGVDPQPTSCGTSSENDAGGGIKRTGGTVYLRNSIISGNMGLYVNTPGFLICSEITVEKRANQLSGAFTDVTYCSIYPSAGGWSATTNTNNLTTDPQLENPSTGYGLLSTSPCIGSGRLDLGITQDIQYDVRPSNGTGYDRGCDEIDNFCIPVVKNLGNLVAGGASSGYKFNGSLRTTGDADVYQFTVAANNSTVVAYTMGNTDTRITLYDGGFGDAAPETDDNSGVGNNAYLKSVKNTGVNYFVEVAGSTFGDYTLVVALEDAVGNVCDAGTGFYLGSNYTGSLEYDGDSDFYEIFSGDQSGQLRLYTVSSLNTYGITLDNDCEQADAQDGGGSGSNFLIDYTFLDKQETRYIAVTTPAAIAATGSYTLVQDFVTDDHGNDYTEARVVPGFTAPQTGTINYGLDKDCFQFYVGEPGGAIGITITAAVFAPVSKLYNSSGVQVGGNHGSSFTEFLFPGIYYVTVENTDGLTTGTYSVAFVLTYDDHEGSCAIGTEEPAFNPLVTPWPGITIINNTIDHACGRASGDVDFFKVTVQKYGTLKAQATPSSGLDPYAALWDWNGNLIGAYVNIETPAAPTWTVGPGEYCISVKSNTKTTGVYHLTLGFDEIATDDHGDACNYLATPMPANSSKKGQINTIGDGDRFRITIPVVGDAVFYTQAHPTSDPDADTYGILYDANCNVITQIGTGGSGTNFSITRTDIMPGTYYLEVEEEGNNATGYYEVFCDFIPDNLCGSSALAPIITQAMIEAAVPYVRTGTITFDALNPIINVHYYGVRLGVAGILKLYTSYDNASTSVDTWGTLRDINCNTLAQNGDEDVNTGKFNFRIEKYVEAGGYYVTVRGESPRAVGAYTLNIELIKDVMTPGDDHGDICDTATQIRSTETAKAGAINFEGDIDYFRYDFGGGPLRVYSTTAVGSAVDPYGFLLDSNCLALDSSDDIDPSGTGPAGTGTPNYNFEIRKKMLDVGTYYIAVREYNRLRTGSYTVNLDLSSGSDTLGDSCEEAYAFAAFPYSETMDYENAEDRLTAGWTVYSPVGGETITNVLDTNLQSYVIQLTGTGTSSGYKLQKADLTDWNNTSQFVMQWKMNYAEAFTIYISCDTPAGHRYIYYDNTDTNLGGAGEYVHHGLGSAVTDGKWRRFTRDLLADLQEFQPGVAITDVNAFLIRGSGRLDDIVLRKAHRTDTYATTIDPRGDVDFYKIPITDNGRLTIWSTTAAGSTFDPFVSLKNSNCNQISFDDDSGDGYNFNISRLAFEGETYYVAVRDWDEETIGGYTLNVQMGDPELAITSIRPTKGTELGGTVVTISGAKFGSVQGTSGRVQFDALNAASYSLWSDTLIVCTTPAHAAAYVNLTVRNDAMEQITQNGGFYFAPQPGITSFAPTYSSCYGGALITITGTKFGNTAATVEFGTFSSQVSTWNDTQIVCQSPSTGTTDDVNITVKTSDEISATSAALFDYRIGPKIVSINPDSSPTCLVQPVTIAGTAFGAAQPASPAGLWVGGTRIAAATWSDTLITFNTTLGAMGVKDVEVRSASYTATPPNDTFKYTIASGFTYYNPAQAVTLPFNYTTMGDNTYQFDLGSVLTINASTSGTTDTYGRLYNSACTLLRESDDISTANLNFSLTNASSPAGSYYVAVSTMQYADPADVTKIDTIDGGFAQTTYSWQARTSGGGTPYYDGDTDGNGATTINGYYCSGYAQWNIGNLAAGKYRIQVSQPQVASGCAQTPYRLIGLSTIQGTIDLVNNQGAWITVYEGALPAFATYTFQIWARDACASIVDDLRVYKKKEGGSGTYTLVISAP